MKILLTGVTGYIGKRLLPVLIREGHQVICAVRDPERLDLGELPRANLQVVETNFLQKDTLENISEDIDVAYYLIHSMSASLQDFENMERVCAVRSAQPLSSLGQSLRSSENTEFASPQGRELLQMAQRRL